MSTFEDVEDCYHDDLTRLGEMRADSQDGKYTISFHCSECNHFVNEVYEFEGTEVIA